MAKINTRVKLINSKLYKCKFYITTKLKTYLYSKGHFANTISRRVFLTLFFLITLISYNSLKDYISQADHKSRNIKVKLIKTKNEAADYII